MKLTQTTYDQSDALDIFIAVFEWISQLVLKVAPFVPYLMAAGLVAVLVLIYSGILPTHWDVVTFTLQDCVHL